MDAAQPNLLGSYDSSPCLVGGRAFLRNSSQELGASDSMTSWSEIRFDMSVAGLNELADILRPHIPSVSDELLNFTNEIQNMVERAPEIERVQRAVLAVKKAVEEASWMDE